MPYASEHIEQSGKEMRAACFSRVSLPQRSGWEEKPLCREVLPPQMCPAPSGKQSPAFLGLLFPLASATCPCTLVYASGRAMHVSQAVEVFPCWLLLLERHFIRAGAAVCCTTPCAHPPLDWGGRNVLPVVKAVPGRTWWARSRLLSWRCAGKGPKDIPW